jgi:hypothetical protein
MSISKTLHFVQVLSCWMLKQKVAPKTGKGRGARVPAVPALVYKHPRCMENYEPFYHNMTHHA